MSGIFGVINWQGKPLEHTELNRMSSSLARRGPDSEGLWLDGAACLGHRMLHTTPESLHETLPFEDTASGLVISADARIDNREALCEALGISNQTRCDISDSYLILLAYKKWGEKCPGHLLGDFSFAIWDKNQQQLFCARDPIGIKPFYYFASDKLFAFASTVPAIRCLSVVPHDINEARIADFLVEALEGIDHTSTFFTTISRLPPANWLLTTKHNTTRQRYWAPVIDNSLTSLQEHESIEAFSEILTQSVHCRQRSLHPTAVMLSGGIDSASILGIARSISQLENNQTVHTFSAVDPQATSLDTACIQLIADQGDIQVHRVRPDQLSDYRENLDWILPNADEPFDHFMLIPQLMYITAREQGINNMMDGGDGDLAVSLSGPYIARLINSGSLSCSI